MAPITGLGTEQRVVRSWAVCEGDRESEGHMWSPGRRVALEPGLGVSMALKEAHMLSGRWRGVEGVLCALTSPHSPIV